MAKATLEKKPGKPVPFNGYGCSSIGRAAVSKTAGREFEPLHPCNEQSVQMDKVIQYFKDSYQELMYKVTWPTMAELQNSTAVVFVASLIIALMIALMDQVLQLSLKGFYGLFS